MAKEAPAEAVRSNRHPRGYDVGSGNIGSPERRALSVPRCAPVAGEGHHIVGLDNLNSYYDPA